MGSAMSSFKEAVDFVILVIDAIGVLVILCGMLLATARLVMSGRRHADPYRRFRQDLGRGCSGWNSW